MPGMVVILVSLCIVSVYESNAQEKTLSINIGGYDYDRTRAIMDGHVSIAEADVEFEVSGLWA